VAKVKPVALERPLAEVAAVVRLDLRRQGKPVYFAAVPYVGAMGSMWSMKDRFGADSAEEVVVRLLGNLGSWRGEVAQRVKAELKGAVNAYRVEQGKKPLY